MSTISLALNLTGAVMLLLFGVHLVRSEIERSPGPSFRRLALPNRGNSIQAACAGVFLAYALQSWPKRTEAAHTDISKTVNLLWTITYPHHPRCRPPRPRAKVY
ncbi:MAG: hypothetical protein OXF88_05960 [Rhodobacteraceae bacterium]|nr:hypothetical protein [Paracoccaceae bacterium]MCY4139500.1 hypothetical protein [Paracoccaceae bacterium]